MLVGHAFMPVTPNSARWHDVVRVVAVVACVGTFVVGTLVSRGTSCVRLLIRAFKVLSSLASSLFNTDADIARSVAVLLVNVCVVVATSVDAVAAKLTVVACCDFARGSDWLLWTMDDTSRRGKLSEGTLGACTC